jgi:hypothetical protein
MYNPASKPGSSLRAASLCFMFVFVLLPPPPPKKTPGALTKNHLFLLYCSFPENPSYEIIL